MVIELVSAVVAFLLLIFLAQRNPPPVNGIYAQAGKWFSLKKYGFYLLYWLRQRKLKNEKGKTLENGPSGYGRKSKKSIEEMECPQELEKDPNALDAVYFEGSDSNGNVFVLRIGRRHKRQCELWLSVNLVDIGFLQSPIHPDTTAYNTDGQTFSAGGLKFENLEPHRRWKITFNGLLQKGLCNEWSAKKDGLVHVKFSFVWEAVSDVFDFDTDIHPNLISDAIALEPWTAEYWKNLRSKHQTHYEQCGEMRGCIKVEGYDEQKLILKSLRDHSYGVRDWASFHRYVVHFVYLEDGTFFHVSHISLPCTTSNLKTGYLSTPSSKMLQVSWTDLNLLSLGENINPPDEYSFNFKAGGKFYAAKVNTRMTPIYHHTDDWSNIIFEKFCNFEVNGVKGYGITEFCYRREGGDCPVPRPGSVAMLQEPGSVSASAETSLILTFTQPAATVARLVGGKGCQLAMLTQMQANSFIVPSGFNLTIAAFSLQLKKSQSLQNKVRDLEQIACGQQKGDIKSACESTVAEFLKTDLAKDICAAISQQLDILFGDESESKNFAVRSSAAGEDSADLSAAGQMDTILGVRGKYNIYKAVTKCWASHFAHPAVEYRRQHGQPIQSNMGVVIQEMVPAQAAGVLFTRDPISGNPALMVINSNYGLGESVVSGVSEPDNICVRREWDDTVNIVNKDIGSKKMQITVTAGGGTKTSDVSFDDVERCSISDNVILNLARIGIELEKAFSDPRDIEWAVAGEQIYLLQARPITTLEQESEWDLMHEFDSPISWNQEVLTTGNIGEMMPGAMTPLTVSVFLRGVEYALQHMHVGMGIGTFHDFWKNLGVYCGQGVINLHAVQSQNEATVAGSSTKMAQLALLGETLDFVTEDIVADYHGRRPALARVVSAIKNVRNLNSSYYLTKEWEEKLTYYTIGQSAKTALELWTEIDKEMPAYKQCWADTVKQSARSAAWTSILMAVLSQGLPNWTTEMYSDVAMLLSKCEDVFSADVPSALQELAKTIADSEKGVEFSTLSPEDAVRWLESSSSGSIGEKYSSFMKRHGHRCIREAEFREKSWRAQPEKLVKVLQSIVPTVNKVKTNKENVVENIQDAIKGIKTTITGGGKFALKHVLPRARRAVGSREWGKSISIQMVDAFKQAYARLGKMMVAEGRLPDADLLYFLIHKEIKDLLLERSGKLVAKAQKRRRILEKQRATKLNRINVGHLSPADENGTEDDYVITSVKVKGLPVSMGKIQGTARVVTSLEGANEIQSGDILIVHYTDVGWSPYFPLISGLVTEIGGLVSHGAVVAREYGLPCIVNCPRATTLFKSGDQVILNGTEGTLEKVEES